MTDEFPHLRNAPAVEAVIHFQAAGRVDQDTLREVVDRVRVQSEFDLERVDERSAFQGEFTVGSQGPPQASQTLLRPAGFAVFSSDEKDVVQLLPGGCIVSRLAPYTSWDEFFPRAWEMWRIYCEVCRPVEATRARVRFINRIEVPNPTDLKQHFEWSVPTGDGPVEDFSMNDFLVRKTLHHEGTDQKVRVAFLSEPSADPSRAFVILDIDAFQDGHWEPLSDSYRDVFGPLRVLKNRIFFATLTDDAMKEFQ